MSSNSRRVRSMERPSTKAWKRSERISSSPAATARAACARLGAAAAAHDGLDARDELLGVARLGQPVVGAEPQPAHALGDRRLARCRRRRRARAAPRSSSLEVLPACGPEHREVDDERAEPHGDERLDRDGAGEHAVLPAQPLQALVEDLQEARVGVDDRKPQRLRGWGALGVHLVAECMPIGHRCEHQAGLGSQPLHKCGGPLLARSGLRGDPPIRTVSSLERDMPGCPARVPCRRCAGAPCS